MSQIVKNYEELNQPSEAALPPAWDAIDRPNFAIAERNNTMPDGK